VIITAEAMSAPKRVGFGCSLTEDDLRCTFDKATRVLTVHAQARVDGARETSVASEAFSHAHGPYESSVYAPDDPRQVLWSSRCRSSHRNTCGVSMQNLKQYWIRAQAAVQRAFNREAAPTKIVPLVRTPDAMIHRVLEAPSYALAPCD